MSKVDRLWQWAKKKPETAVLGRFLYEVGFWGEYTVIRMGRSIKNRSAQAVHWVRELAAKVGSVVARAFKNAWEEITAPFKRFHNGIRSIIALMREERKTSKTHAVKEGAAYFGRGVKLYYPLIRTSVAYLLPLVALGIFGYTVKTVLNYNYTLAVEVDGNVVGYVKNEQVFDEATAEIAQRIKPINGETVDWKIEPRYTVAISDETMEVGAMADSILRASSDEISDATALYVNGQIVGVTTEGEKLEQAIAAMKAPYEDPNNPNLRVEFTKEIGIENGIYATNSLSSADDIIAILNGEEQGELIYEVQKGDVPSSIASQHGLSTQQLIDMNPQQDILNFLHIGDKLIIQQSMPYLQVRRIETRTEQENIEFKKVERDSNELGFGQSKVVQQGENGLDEVVREYVYYGDSTEPSAVTEISRVHLKEPVDQITERGKRLANGDLVQTANGPLMWPVPGHRYVSRWASSKHGGADICAPYGTPIYAANSGVVVTAGWHWSYGNHVVINHGNGMTTIYAHASKLLVSPGQAVQQGDMIALVGSTGQSTGNHCHFEIKINGARRNPHDYFPNKR